MDKAIVVTSIHSPRKEIKALAKIPDWKLVGVGDANTPRDWFLPQVDYLSVKRQSRLFPEFSHMVPLNTYARKNLGFLYAMKNGAMIIAETDDDVFPDDNYPPDLAKERMVPILSGDKFINIFRFFDAKTQSWPRGLPLTYIKNHQRIRAKKGQVKSLMLNSLVDGDGDFDAVYRLLFNAWVSFKKRGEYALAKGCYCPMNSQNTFTHREAFVLLYLPSFVNPHVEDIWRGYIAQRILWEMGARVVFTHPTAFTTERNMHDLMEDFENELPLFLQTNRLIKVLDTLSLSKDPFVSLVTVYRALIKVGVFPKAELQIVQLWARLVEKLVVT
ncbi:MAG: DUF288 domain-containing protein [Candidatus Chisholmbacteria bacterium]|nr:DUF288 domain-containing protein [Candidatus Chisholmbacteria bacterium]